MELKKKNNNLILDVTNGVTLRTRWRAGLRIILLNPSYTQSYVRRWELNGLFDKEVLKCESWRLFYK